MKIKRLLASILVLTMIFLAFPISSVSAASNNGTMLHYENFSKSENALLQLIKGNIKADTSYTLNFRYHFEQSGFATSGAGVYVGIYGHDTTIDSPSKKYGNHFLRMKTSRYTTSQFPKLADFTSVKIDEYEATYTFSFSANDLENMSDLYAGFYFVGSSSQGTTFDMYIGDMILYETADNLKSNLLNSGVSSNLDGWYSTLQSGSNIVGAESLPYNKAFFYPRRTMLHYHKNLPSDENYFNQKIVNTLEQDTSYTVSFRYHFADGSNTWGTSGAGLYFGLFGHDTTSVSTKKGGNTYLRMSGTRFTGNISSYPRVSGFTSSDIGESSALFTFSLSSADFVNISNFYLSFYQIKSNIDIYIADLVLYKTNDKTKTNLLACNEYTDTLTNWYDFNSSGDSLSSYAEYEDYDEILFPKSKKMIHYHNITNTSYETSFIEGVNGNLKANTLYTLSMSCFMEKGKIITTNGAGAYIGLFGHDTTVNSPSKKYGNKFIRMTGTRFNSQYPNLKGFISTDISDNNINLVFSLSQDDLVNIDAFFVGFHFVNPNIDMYISDLVLYESADKEKTNLLFDDEYSENLSHFYDCYSYGADLNNVATVMDYNALLFTKNMIHIKTENAIPNDTTFLQYVSKPFEADKEYTLTFNYKFSSGIFDKDSLCTILFGYDGSHGRNWDKPIAASRKGFVDDVMFKTISYTAGKAEYTFSLTEAQITQYSKFLVGFYFLKQSGMTYDFYIANMSLYCSDDVNKTNLLLWKCGNANKKIWVNDYDYADNSVVYSFDYLPYDSSYFESVKAPRKGDANGDYLISLTDLVSQKKQASFIKTINLNSDINGDYLINSIDLVALRKHLLGSEKIVWDLSVMKNENMTGGYDSQTNARKEQIHSNPDTLHGSRVFYVSAFDPSANVKTVDEINNLSLRSGDSVLLKRGEIFRASSSVNLVSGVFYGAYGAGEKPIVAGSLRNYADASLWTTKDGIIWKTVINDAEDAGNITFNNGEFSGFRKSSLNNLVFDGDYYINETTGELSLLMNNCNPGAYFDSIEIASTDILFLGIGSGVYSRVHDITVENICFKNAATCAINTRFTSNLSVRGCEFYFIGGSYFGDTGTRYGNALEMYNDAKDSVIKDNIFYQIYDSAITFQGPKNSKYSNIKITDNVIEYSSLNFEFWSSDADKTTQTNLIKDIDFCRNILRFGGFGFAGKQRDYTPDQSFVLGFHTKYTASQLNNFNITENVFDVANSYFYYVTGAASLLNISSNTYYQKPGSFFKVICGEDSYADSQQSFETAIGIVDASPKAVTWLS